ncbi:MAG TPA: EAL domain-containing protein [Gammaproteobacteria bacterium]|jgi:diguanylate cyclase (GGDEF)-like protein/PAS domain S-box-containing protein|nr:EAL domain-containing protein [Gammaproteobacteria bacterium]
MAEKKRVEGETARAGAGGPRVLLVDDNPDDRALVERELRKDFPDALTFQVSTPAQLEAAIAQPGLDLVITDFHLKWSTGLEVLKRIRSRDQDLPVIMFTGTGTEEVAVEAMRLGLADYVTKSSKHMPRLRRSVKAALSAATHARAREQAENLLADALGYIEDGFIIFDADDKVVVSNEQLKLMYPHLAPLMVPGTKFEDMLRAAIDEDKIAIPDGDAEKWLRDRLEAHHRSTGSLEQRLPDGRWVLIKERRSRDGGYINVYTDVTALKQRELELEKLLSEHVMLGAAVSQSPAGVMVADATGDERYLINYTNPAFQRITGYTFEEVRGRDWTLLKGEETSPQTCDEVNAALRAHRSIQVEIINYRKDGTKFWNELSISPVFDEQGAVKFFVGVLTDISERVRTRDVLEERTSMLGEAEHLAHLGHWRWDIASNKLWWSDEVYRIRGLDPRRIDPDFNRTLSTYHPDDQPYVEKFVRHAAATHESVEFEARVVRPDGQIRHVRVKGQYSPPTPDAGESVFGIFQDITSQKESEAALRRSERQYRRLMEAVPHGIKEIALDGVITYANQAHHEMLGYMPGGLVGKKVFDIIADAPQRAEAEQRFRKLVTGERPSMAFTTRYLTADGRIIDVQVDAVISRNESGGINGVISVTTDITERVQSEKRLRYLAFYDPLTGLGNRVLLTEHLADQFRYAGADRRVAVVLCNIDGFKIINDVLGHDAGDSVLREFGTRLSAAFGGSEGVARLAADEFAAVIIGDGSREALRQRLESVKGMLEAPLQLPASRLDLRVSMGVAMAPQDGETAEALLRNADNALLEVKRQDPGGLRFYNADMKALAEEYLTLRGNLRRATMQGEIYLEYQPQVELIGGKVAGLEALARWRTADGALISPAKFIPIAEQSGDILMLGSWLLEAACRQAVSWRSLGVPLAPLTVNVSPRQFLQDDMVATVKGILDRTGLEAHMLQLELTETALMTDSPAVLQRMDDLADMGVGFSLDDFGTGYSSLSYLNRFPIRTIKVDRSFVAGVPDDARQAAIVNAVIAMGHELGIKVVAEGVEAARQGEFLREAGCDMAQGFYYSHPLSADACADILRQGSVPMQRRR